MNLAMALDMNLMVVVVVVVAEIAVVVDSVESKLLSVEMVDVYAIRFGYFDMPSLMYWMLVMIIMMSVLLSLLVLVVVDHY